jgi:hypothetical protein
VQISQTADNGPLVQADSWREEYYQGGALALKQLVAPGRPGLVHDPKDRGVLGRTWSVLSGLRLVLTENYSWRTIASRYQWSKLSSGRLRRNCLVAEVGPKIVDSMTKARVYIDANILKFSATSLLRFRPREVMVDWGGKRQPLTVHDPVTVNPNDGIANNPELRREAELLAKVAALAASGIVDFLINIETQMEVWGLPNLDSETGSFYGAPHTLIAAPVQYGRIMFGGNDDYKKEQFNFLRSLRHERFGELQRITGAYQGETKINRNQLLDAFHLWCAEHTSELLAALQEENWIRPTGARTRSSLPANTAIDVSKNQASWRRIRVTGWLSGRCRTLARL